MRNQFKVKGKSLSTKNLVPYIPGNDFRDICSIEFLTSQVEGMDGAPVLRRSSSRELVGGLRSRRHVFTFPPLVLILLLSMEKSIIIIERMYREMKLNLFIYFCSNHFK